MGVQEKRRNRFEEKKIPEEIMTENFLHFGKTNLQIHGAQANYFCTLVKNVAISFGFTSPFQQMVVEHVNIHMQKREL